MERQAIKLIETPTHALSNQELLQACGKCLRIRAITHGLGSKGGEACAAESGEANEERIACSRALERVVRGEEVA